MNINPALHILAVCHIFILIAEGREEAQEDQKEQLICNNKAYDCPNSDFLPIRPMRTRVWIMMYRRPRSICCCCNRCYMHRPLITSCAVFICDNTFNPANANAHTEVERNAIHLLLVAELLLMTQFACLLLSCRTPIERLKGFIYMIIVPESFYILISNNLFTDWYQWGIAD